LQPHITHSDQEKVTWPKKAEKASSKFKDGILELTLPKVKKAKRHTVKVE